VHFYNSPKLDGFRDDFVQEKCGSDVDNLISPK